MAGRLLDIASSLAALVLLSPLIAVSALGILLSSPGPVLYRARRAGLNGKVFTMYKFRTMHANHGSFSSAITARDDPRVFPFGAWLRRFKMDELPQLFNVLRGDMSVVGPRPEDPDIVRRFYAPLHFETLQMLPGLASPGSIYNYAHGERLLKADDPERYYVERLLPIKLALDIAYVREASLSYDLRIICRTIWTILTVTLGRREFPDPPEMKKAVGMIYPVKQSSRVI